MTDLWLFIVEKAALSSARSVFSTQTGFLAVRARFSRGSPEVLQAQVHQSHQQTR